MLIRFENKSNRVKGLAFHPKRPWILASLHNGTVQMWDYRMEVLIDKFEEHEGPVRGLDFHNTQPLFVSGGDDYKIKVWNYSLRRCLFNLLGHLDYIRTVQFHHEYPWIVSASDDQTIRIWNWQSRTCLSVLTGHNHYVMCAQFHPSEDLVLSASLDQNVRVWDMSVLRKKNVSIMGERQLQQQQHQDDMFGGGDVVVKYVLEGHSRGVNWAQFHKTMPLIVSGADDREVKLWRMNEQKAWEVDSYRGHTNNVSCVVFHPRHELIVSNSEDKSIRIWDISKQAGPVVYRRDADRYWILVAHPNLNLLAAGHDSGMVVFKLERERPAYRVGKQLFYYKDRYIRAFDFKSGKDIPILSTRRATGSHANSATQPHSLDYNTANPNEHNVLLFTNADGGTYELYSFAKSKSGSGGFAEEVSAPMRGLGKAAVFVSRNRFCVLDKSKTQLSLKNLSNETKRKIALPVEAGPTVSHIFGAGLGRIILRAASRLVLFDVQSRKALGVLPVHSRNPVKYVSWAQSHKYCALMSKFTLFITDGNLAEICTVNETSRIKSGAWDPAGVFVYTTANHIKYCLPNGDNGIIRTLDVPVYITAVRGRTLFALDREWNSRQIDIDNTEYLFKQALCERRYRDVLRLIMSQRLVGESIIAYLQKKGFPEVALHFVQDPKTKFDLALECGNIKVALDCAVELNQDDCWHKLGVEALRQGNHQVVEMAYQKTKNFERLSFLYLLTGNLEKLSKMLHISTLREDIQGRFHNALFLGNVEERVAVLKDAGQLQLAYLCAKAHGLADAAAELEELLGDETPELPSDLAQKATLLFPPTPIFKADNWPLLEVSKGFFDGIDPEQLQVEGESTQDHQHAHDEAQDETGVDDVIGDWGVKGDQDDDFLGLGDIGAHDQDANEEGNAFGDWGDLGIDVPMDQTATGDDEAPDGNSDYFVMPTPGETPSARWSEKARTPADLIASGSFDLAMQALFSQCGIVDFAPLKPYFMQIFTASHAAMPTLPGTQSIPSALQRDAGLPRLSIQLSACTDRLKAAYKGVTDGKALQQAKAHFQAILHMVPLIDAGNNKQQAKEMDELVEICRQYIVALSVELEKRQTGASDPVRTCELALYFTRCKLQPLHLFLGLRGALQLCYKLENFKTTSFVCRRMLELAISSKLPAQLQASTQKVKGVLKVCDQKGTDARPLEYDERSTFEICAATYKPIKKGGKYVTCPYCRAAYKPRFSGETCRVCQIGKVGHEANGASWRNLVR